MARPPRQIVLTEETRKQLEKITRSRTQRAGLQKRARIIMQCADGQKIADIANDNKVTNPQSSCGRIVFWNGELMDWKIIREVDARLSMDRSLKLAFLQSLMNLLLMALCDETVTCLHQKQAIPKMQFGDFYGNNEFVSPENARGV